MKKKSSLPQAEDADHETVPAFAYELLRDVLIPELVGEEESIILYWAGKNIARKYPLETTEDFIQFFHHAGWGELAVNEEKKNQIIFQFSSESVIKKIRNGTSASFSLETGFLAQQIEMMKNRPADARKEMKKKKVIVTVQWER